MNKFLKENKIPLALVTAVAVLYALFFFITFTVIQPGTFLTSLDGGILETDSSIQRKENWRPVPLARNFSSLFASGVSLSAFAPDMEKIAAHPAVVKSAEKLWPTLEILILLLNGALLWLVHKYSSKKEHYITAYLLLGIFISILMVILARPDHNTVPDFDYRYAGPPYYFYSIFLTLGALWFIRAKKETAGKVVIATIIVILALQQVFSFHSLRLKEESVQRKEAVLKLEDTLIKELAALSQNGEPVTIPNLTGAHIFQGMPGYTLADYIWFFGTDTPIALAQNEFMPPDVKTKTVKTVSSVRDSTNPEFLRLLGKEGSAIRTYYTSPVRLRMEASPPEDSQESFRSDHVKGNVLIKSGEFDPEELTTVEFVLTTDNVSGNIELSFSYNNDFETTGEAGKIRVDDYTAYLTNADKRLYKITINLLQIYTYSLSSKVSELTLHIPDSKNSSVSNLIIKEQ
ncbi:MAG: hypothetical protein Q8P86_01605 [bacterium]|nr:hypothetical protein [bacterium]